MEQITGIYKIESKIKPERIYIGSAININKRWVNHLSDLRNNKHHSPKLQNHVNKYGSEDLLFTIILKCHIENLEIIEQVYVNYYDPWFNIHKIAINSNYGMEMTDEQKEKISKSHIGKQTWLGKHHKEESKKLISEIKKKNVTEQFRERMRQINLGNHNASGHVCSNETKQIIRNNKLGNKCHLGFKHSKRTLS
jgi:group I intron endonuclease